MCRSAKYEPLVAEEADPHITITAFYARLLGDNNSNTEPFSTPDSLTLLLRNSSTNSEATLSLRKMMVQRLPSNTGAVFGCKQRVRAAASTRFQLYAGETNLLNGTIKKSDCGSRRKIPFSSISGVELWVAFDGHVAVQDKASSIRKNKAKLEDIPEETDDVDADDLDPETEEALEMDLQVLRKAMDMGVWVLCLGLGFIVSRASITKIRPPPTFSWK